MRAIHTKILAWYHKEKRALPWRKNKDPYRIWISEIMLQQTRVETVIPYFERFLRFYPTVAHLAEANDDQLMNLWAGLGYYSRARNLKIAAQDIVNRFAGRIPKEILDLRTLKGIGPYTASAIASIAHNTPVAAIDGNLERVIARLMALKKNPKLEGKKEIEQFAQKLIHFGQAGDLNQALMDLSSKICLPKNPRCNQCPIHQNCLAFNKGIEKELPIKKPKSAPISLQAQGLVIASNKEVLLVKRPAGAWLAGLWDLPWWVGEKISLNRIGTVEKECAVHRTITKHKIHTQFSVVICRSKPSLKKLKSLPAPAQEFRWVPLCDLSEYALPRASEKALALFLPALQ